MICYILGFLWVFVCMCVFVNKCFVFFLKVNINLFVKFFCKVFLRGLKKFGFLLNIKFFCKVCIRELKNFGCLFNFVLIGNYRFVVIFFNVGF